MANMPFGYTTTPITKKKKKPVAKVADLSRASDGNMKVPAKGSAGKGAYTSTNTTSNARAGQNYRTETRAGGVVHVYANGQRVFVKKKKSANPARTFKPYGKG